MEEWRAIPGYEGLYEASSFGQIRTAEGKTTSNARFQKRVWKQRVLKQKCTKNSKGRKDSRVSLWKDGKEKTWLVSRLVAMTFCNGFSEGMTVNHIDGNPLNNHVSNLEWVSLKRNIQLAFENGLYRTQKAYELNGIRYRSQAEASRSIGRTSGYIANCKMKGKTPRSSPGVA